MLSRPGSGDRPNEDAVAAAGGWVVVADGATARTETGCVHGVAWFARRLVDAVVEQGEGEPAAALRSALARTADLHRGTCDLTDVATPGAAIGVVAVSADLVRFLVLGDVTVLVEETVGPDRLSVTVDDRVSRTAAAERAAADALPHGSPGKCAALVAMKRAELAARNAPGGFWAAAADPVAADHAITWALPRPRVGRVAILTDGAARAVDLFGLLGWPEVLELLEREGPDAVVRLVREAERADPHGERWTRNKISDDASIGYLDLR
jgi:hypothetical protein